MPRNWTLSRKMRFHFVDLQTICGPLKYILIWFCFDVGLEWVKRSLDTFEKQDINEQLQAILLLVWLLSFRKNFVAQFLLLFFGLSKAIVSNDLILKLTLPIGEFRPQKRFYFLLWSWTKQVICEFQIGGFPHISLFTSKWYFKHWWNLNYFSIGRILKSLNTWTNHERSTLDTFNQFSFSSMRSSIADLGMCAVELKVGRHANSTRKNTRRKTKFEKNHHKWSIQTILLYAKREFRLRANEQNVH